MPPRQPPPADALTRYLCCVQTGEDDVGDPVLIHFTNGADDLLLDELNQFDCQTLVGDRAVGDDVHGVLVFLDTVSSIDSTRNKCVAAPSSCPCRA